MVQVLSAWILDFLFSQYQAEKISDDEAIPVAHRKPSSGSDLDAVSMHAY
jgi:hypothetical protein